MYGIWHAVIVFGCLSCQFQLCSSGNEQQIMRTAISQGTVSGFTSFTEKGSRYYSFRGIPYAIPPINELRFKDPIQHPGWEGELFANHYGPPCPQWDITTSSVIGREDCLTLNVFTPQLPTMYRFKPLPVMVYIHGGAFMTGSSSLYGAAKLLTQPIALVTVNYRLGVLGFLGTEDEISPGNYGMLDLVLALQWVRENIATFGGDYQRVTIFGENSGAAAVSHLILSPLAKGLFWMGITQSGSALCDWAVEENPLGYATLLASSFGCGVETSVSIVECLRHKSIEELVTAQQGRLNIVRMFIKEEANLILVNQHNHMLFIDDSTYQFIYEQHQMTKSRFSYFPLRTAPVIDKGFRSRPFLPDSPEKLLESGNFSKVPIISGVVENEGLLFVLQILLRYAEQITFDVTFFEDIILPQSIDSMTDAWYTANKVNQIKNFYFKNVNFGNITEVIAPFVEVTSDVLINSCNDKMVKLHSKFVPVYMYVFSHRGLRSYSDTLIHAIQKAYIDSPIFHTGVSHGDDLLYQFNLPNMEPNETPEDQRVQEIMTLLWTTFAQKGTPNVQPTSASGQPPSGSTFWNSFQEINPIYFNISIYPYVDQDYRQFQLSVLNFIDSLASIPEKYTNPREPYFTVTWVLTAVAILLFIICIILAILLVIKSRRGNYSTDSLTITGIVDSSDM